MRETCENAPFPFPGEKRILIPKGKRIRKTGKEGRAMFGKRKDRVILEVTADEMRILRKTMLLFRNRMIEAGKPTEDIEGVIGKLVFR